MFDIEQHIEQHGEQRGKESTTGKAAFRREGSHGSLFSETFHLDMQSIRKFFKDGA
jgi:hypothetical protein